jgi:hypothetical protein
MKNRLSVLAALILIAVLVLAVPVGAKQPEPVGERFDLLHGLPLPAPPQTYTAGEPFHIIHGHGLNPQWTPTIGLHEFKLTIDGVAVEEDFVIRTVDPSSDFPLTLLWLYNFPDGMTSGEHTFTGQWIVPCTGPYPDPSCPAGEIVVVAFERSLDVTFTSTQP